MTLYEHKIQNAYIGEYITKLEYDFTQSDGGWTIHGANIYRDSNGYRISGTNVDGYITPPSDVYNKTPKKIYIIYDRYIDGSISGVPGTGIYSGVNSNYWYFLPRNIGNNTFDWSYNGTITSNSVSLTSTSDITWELDINSSTTNRTITHKITGNNNITDTSGVLKYLWTNNALGVRTVRWGSGTGPCIKKVIIEY